MSATDIPPAASPNNPFLSGNMMLIPPTTGVLFVPGGKGKGSERLDHNALARRVLLGVALVFFVVGMATLSHDASQFLDDAPMDHHRRSLAESIDRTLFSGLHLLRGRVNKTDPGLYVPIYCDAFMKDNDQGYDLSKKKQKKFKTGRDPQFWVSAHRANGALWHFMSSDEYYERSLLASLAEVVKSSPPGSRVLDVGPINGFSTFLAASQAQQVAVDSFEPKHLNRVKICESLQMNEWGRNEYEEHPSILSTVNLYSFAVGREEAIIYKEENIFGSMTANWGTFDGKTRVITLDQFATERGWFDEDPPHIAALRISTEDHDHNAILGAVELLRAKMIRNIFMEVSVRSDEEIAFHKPALRLLDIAGYKVHKVGGWKGVDMLLHLDNLEEGQDLADKIIEKTKEEKTKLLNLQWTLP